MERCRGKDYTRINLLDAWGAAKQLVKIKKTIILTNKMIMANKINQGRRYI